MSDPVAFVDDLALYLNDPNIDVNRAQFILDLAHEQCETIVDPLPTTARSVVLDVAQRAYANPTSVRNTSLGLYAEDEGPFSDGSPGTTGGGVWLTAGNVTALRNLGGGGGAFSIDMTPAGAGASLPWWDTGSVWTQP